MQDQHDDHRAGAVVMQAAEKLPGCNLLGDVGDTGMRRLRGRNVIEREAQPGNDLRDKDEEQPGTEYIGQARPTGNGFIQRRLHQAVDASAFIEPAIDTRWRLLLRGIGLHWIIHKVT